MLRRALRRFSQIQKGSDGQEYKNSQVPMDSKHPHYMMDQDYYWTTKNELPPHHLDIRTDVD